MTAFTPLSWHTALWRRLWGQYQNKTLPHALLFSGLSGLGKQTFAENFAKTLLCLSPNQHTLQSCHQCQSCFWFDAKTHPNYYPAYPEAPNRLLGIDQIRQLIDAIRYTTQPYSASLLYKIALIYPADTLSLAASNALLKTLEEPTANTLFILVSSRVGTLAATVRSRCQSIQFTLPSETDALSWLRTQITHTDSQLVDEESLLTCLQLAEGAPLEALSLLQTLTKLSYAMLLNSLESLQAYKQNPSKIAKEWETVPTSQLLDRLTQIISDLVKCKLGVSPTYWRGQAYKEKIKILAEKVSLSFLFDYLDALQNTRQTLYVHRLNPLLSLESLSYRWQL